MPRNLIIHLVGAFLSGALPLATLPIFAHLLDPEDIGVFAIFAALLSMLVPILGLNLHGYCARAYHAEGELVSAISASILISVSITGLCLFLLWVNQIFSLFDLANITSLESSKMLFLAVLMGLMRFLIYLILGQYQTSKQAEKYVVFKALFISSELLFSLLAIVFISNNLEMRLLGLVASYFCFGTLALSAMLRLGVLNARVGFSGMLDALVYGLKLMPFTISGVALVNLDKLILAPHVAPEALASYFLLFSAIMIIGVFGETINRAVMPFLYELLNRREPITKILTFYGVLILIVSLISSLAFPYLIPMMFPEKYAFSVMAIYGLIAFQSVRCYNFVASSLLIYFRRPDLQSIGAGMSLAILLLWIISGQININSMIQALITSALAQFFLYFGFAGYLLKKYAISKTD